METFSALRKNKIHCEHLRKTIEAILLSTKEEFIVSQTKMTTGVNNSALCKYYMRVHFGKYVISLTIRCLIFNFFMYQESAWKTDPQ